MSSTYIRIQSNSLTGDSYNLSNSLVLDSKNEARFTFKNKDIQDIEAKGLETLPRVTSKQKSSRKPRYTFRAEEIDNLDLSVA